jgi:outer membrane protein OmpA-like peptidoglycan-associated protein
VQIDTIILQGGQIDFSDRHLPRPFRADMREVGGRIEGLTSEPGARATVDLRGSLRNQSPLTITGTVNPLVEKLFLDLKLNFTDIELSPLSPYSGTYVGYLIDKGKLNLTLEYFIEDDKLKAKNEVFLDQFSFGGKVESDQATSLPVKLAVALLKDRNGEIHLDIPVSGSLDDPQFSIGGVVWTIIKNLLVKAATSPFALLGALVGGSDEDFSSVSFESGSARLSDAEKDKLQRMAQALTERPGLEVEISGFVDPENDPEGYRKEQLSMQVKHLKYLDLLKQDKLPEGTREVDVTVSPERYPDYLWEVYKETDFPKPRNFIGMTKKLPVTEMEKLIYASTTVNENDLANLAQDRALAVQNFLAEEGQIAKARIFLKKQDITEAPTPETAPRARVELGATVR